MTLPGLATEPVFRFLPDYARFLLDKHMADFTSAVLRTSRELQMSLLKYFEAMPEEELLALSLQGNQQLLSAIVDRNIAVYQQQSLKNWKENRLPLIQSNDIVIDDISKASFTRRKAFRDFLPLYTQDPEIYINVMEEADRFTLLLEEASYKTLLEMKEAKLREHNHFIDKINNTSPGIIYVYDLQARRQIYTNHNRETLLGFSEAEMDAMEGAVIETLVHPEDRGTLLQHLQCFQDDEDGGVHTTEYRIRNSQGKYIWQRDYATIFLRDESGAPQQIIGIALDVSAEKETAARLAQREAQLHEAQEIAGMGSFEWDLLGGESAFSPNLLRIFLMEERGNLPDFLQFVHPADRDSVKEAIACALRGEQDYECEYRYLKDKKERIIWSRGKVVFANGRAAKMKGTVMDVTQRHDMIKRLARSEQLHKQAQALTHLGNWSWSVIDDKVEWSDEMYRIFGLEPQSEQITLGRILSLLHPDDRESRRLALHTAIETHEAEDYNMRVVGSDGSVKYVDGKSEVLFDEFGKAYKIIGTCQDVTKQHLLTERLRENEEASRHLILNAPEAIVVIDEHSKILLWNPKAEAIFGWSYTEAVGKTLMDTIIPHQYGQAHFNGVRRLQAGGEPRLLNRTIEIDALRRDGTTFYISLTVSRSTRAGEPVFIAFIRDISVEKETELKLAEQRAQLTQKARDLERSNSELMAFNYIASHDLKEPVRKIGLFSKMIMDEAGEILPPRLSNAIERISTSADRMERLIGALISFSHTTNSERQLEHLSLDSVVAEIKLLFKEKLEETGGAITVAPLPNISGDYFQMQQLFENLIGNALKYGRAGVAPNIQVSSAEVSGASIAALGADGSRTYYQISIADNGIGFEQQYAEKIFEVFQRLHGKEAYSGTGIGLAICKKIMQQHEGFIAAESRPDAGATFFLYFPAIGTL